MLFISKMPAGHRCYYTFLMGIKPLGWSFSGLLSETKHHLLRRGVTAHNDERFIQRAEIIREKGTNCPPSSGEVSITAG